MVEIRVLGPIEVERDGRAVAVGGRNERAVLAALVLSLNRAVSTDTLAWILWGDELPPSAHATLQTYVSHLRSLCGDVIRFGDDCYTLDLDPAAIDLVAFERLVIAARAAIGGDATTARDAVVAALHLWRGEPFGVLAGDEFVAVEGHRLHELRLEAVELRLEADIELGNEDAAIGHLESAVDDNPYRERLWFLLMTALARTGRRVEAVRAFRSVQDILAETGLEPSAELRDLEADIISEAPSVRAHLTRADHPPM